MPRRLTDDELALWARVTASVRPIRQLPPDPAPPRAAAQPDRPVPPAAPAPPRRPTLPPPALAAGLDGHWDRRLRGGRLIPELTVDLHGFSRLHAHAHLARRLQAAAHRGVRVALVITGKGGPTSLEPADLMAPGRLPRGAIRASLPGWLDAPDLRPLVLAARPAHPRHGGGGAWYVILRRPPA